MRRLLEALQHEKSGVTLDIAALELATIEFPNLDVPGCVACLDTLAEQVSGRLSSDAALIDFVHAANEVLFEVLQFRGNEEEYYDPRNSCLNSVLTRRLGIPITLSLLYMEVGRRLGRTVEGIGLPGHFIVGCSDKVSTYWIDPFHGGRILTFADCCKLAKEASDADLRANPALLAPLPKRQILIRMLSNLKVIYLRGESFNKARQVLDLLISAMPDYPEEYRHRGTVHLRQLNHRAAKEDLETYLRLEPNAPEREEVKKQLLLIERWKAGLN
ncbi:MAG: transglutaminase family protein [Acidobacteriaceae bacterium]|nr:transglutaminase family protein [Acidobacteriaceae bacterium]